MTGAVRTSLTALCMIAACTPALGQRFRFDDVRRGQSEVAVFVGYGENHRIPHAVDDRYAFDTAKVRFGHYLSPRNEVIVDLAVGKQNTGQRNSAIWLTGTYRYVFVTRGSTALSVDASFGIFRLRDAVDTLGTRTNFTEQLGLSFQYATGPRSAVTLEYKFSHISNGGIRLPNIGINASMLSVGHSWYP
jgi:hypothetical protein